MSHRTPSLPSIWRRAGGRRGLCVAMILLAGAARAAKPLEGCAISTTPLSFGVYNPLSATPTTMQTSVFIDCASKVKWAYLTLDSGPSAKPGFRQMRSGASALDYNVYLDVAYAQVWANGETLPPVDMEKQGNLTLWLYGRVPALQNPNPGSYTDTLTLTIVTP